jgi:hypothetical protein
MFGINCGIIITCSVVLKMHRSTRYTRTYRRQLDLFAGENVQRVAKHTLGLLELECTVGYTTQNLFAQPRCDLNEATHATASPPPPHNRA